MPPSRTAAFRLGALAGLLGVAFGAFGAHALKAVLAWNQTTAIWETAVLYHLVHAVVLLVLGTIRPFPRGAWVCFGVGLLAFSGSLYAYALTHILWLNFITPFGGVFLLAGWFLLMLRPPVSNPDPS